MRTIHRFKGIDGEGPFAWPVMYGEYMYGTASNGGPHGHGVIFKVSFENKSFEILHAFEGRTDGANPVGLVDYEDVFYGTTTAGGKFGKGTIYKIKPDGSEFQIIHHFTNEEYPAAVATLGPGGYLYGTTTAGGKFGKGTIYKIKPDGSEFQVIYSFHGGTEGAEPCSFVVCIDEYLWGATRKGGAHGHGVMFKIYPNGGDYHVWHHCVNPMDVPRPHTMEYNINGNIYGIKHGYKSYGYGVIYMK